MSMSEFECTGRMCAKIRRRGRRGMSRTCLATLSEVTARDATVDRCQPSFVKVSAVQCDGSVLLDTGGKVNGQRGHVLDIKDCVPQGKFTQRQSDAREQKFQVKEIVEPSSDTLSMEQLIAMGRKNNLSMRDCANFVLEMWKEQEVRKLTPEVVGDAGGSAVMEVAGVATSHQPDSFNDFVEVVRQCGRTVSKCTVNSGDCLINNTGGSNESTAVTSDEEVMSPAEGVTAGRSESCVDYDNTQIGLVSEKIKGDRHSNIEQLTVSQSVQQFQPVSTTVRSDGWVMSGDFTMWSETSPCWLVSGTPGGRCDGVNDQPGQVVEDQVTSVDITHIHEIKSLIDSCSINKENVVTVTEVTGPVIDRKSVNLTEEGNTSYGCVENDVRKSLVHKNDDVRAVSSMTNRRGNGNRDSCLISFLRSSFPRENKLVESGDVTKLEKSCDIMLWEVEGQLDSCRLSNNYVYSRKPPRRRKRWKGELRYCCQQRSWRVDSWRMWVKVVPKESRYVSKDVQPRVGFDSGDCYDDVRTKGVRCQLTQGVMTADKGVSPVIAICKDKLSNIKFCHKQCTIGWCWKWGKIPKVQVDTKHECVRRSVTQGVVRSVKCQTTLVTADSQPGATVKHWFDSCLTPDSQVSDDSLLCATLKQTLPDSCGKVDSQRCATVKHTWLNSCGTTDSSVTAESYMGVVEINRKGPAWGQFTSWLGELSNGETSDGRLCRPSEGKSCHGWDPGRIKRVNDVDSNDSLKLIPRVTVEVGSVPQGLIDCVSHVLGGNCEAMSRLLAFDMHKHIKHDHHSARPKVEMTSWVTRRSGRQVRGQDVQT